MDGCGRRLAIGQCHRQGSVDFCLALHGSVSARGQHTFWHWFAIAENLYAARPLDEIVAQYPQQLLDEARSHWRQWIKRGTLACDPLPDEIEEIYHRSLLVMVTQTDHEGAILAATDSDILRFGKDTYNYCWPRDAALIAHAYSTAGCPEVAANFFRFGTRVVTPDGFFTHKYNPMARPDQAGSHGSTTANRSGLSRKTRRRWSSGRSGNTMNCTRTTPC